MPRITLYVPDDLVKDVAELRARLNGSLSSWLAERVRAELAALDMREGVPRAEEETEPFLPLRAMALSGEWVP